MKKILESIAKNKSEWLNPLDVFSYVADKYNDYAFLHSGKYIAEYSGRYSLLGYEEQERISCNNFKELNKIKNSDKLWLGYWGYDEKRTDNNNIACNKFPVYYFTNYKNIVVFDNVEKKLYHSNNCNLGTKKQPKEESVTCKKTNSSSTKKQYIQQVKEIKSKITSGQVYQVNLTRKFFGSTSNSIKPEDIFFSLNKDNPSPYSAIIRFSDKCVISSSPEQFIKFGEDKLVETRPIKGTSKKYSNKIRNKNSISKLLNEKNKAENLMITDLMRNDISQYCEVGSVSVEKLYEINSYSNVHQLSSTIKAKRLGNKNLLNCIAMSMPPGSMTGAPKIEAMKIIDQLEDQPRGVYSGIIGWIMPKHNLAEFSVVIRAILLAKDKFEFQVGGGIVHDSEEEDELEETIHKAKSILATLNLDKKIFY